MSNIEVADVIVIGLGAFGSATAYQLAKRGAKVIAIDQFSPPHSMGSSHGATRITRLAVGEGEIYAPLVKRSNEIWRELEALQDGLSLYLPTGGIIMGPEDGLVCHHGKRNFVQRTIDTAVQFGIDHEVLRGSQISDRFPQFLLRGDELAYYEPQSGVLRPEECVSAQIEAARHHGAVIRLGEKVESFESSQTGALVRTNQGTYAANRVVVTAGPWVPGLAGPAYAACLKVMRQVLYWFKPQEPEMFASPAFPVFIWMHGEGDEDYMYGFPMVDGHGGVKVATEQYRVTTDPDQVDRTVSIEEKSSMFEQNVRGRLRGVTPECVHSAVCMYTVSSDSGFVVDQHQDSNNITVVSACSGHGFKHSAALGESIAMRSLDLISNSSTNAFSLKRFENKLADAVA